VSLFLNGSADEYASAENVNTGSTNVGRIRLHGSIDVDDMYVASDDVPLGDCYVRTRTPDADGNHEDWATDDASPDSYARVDDGTSHDGDTTHIASATPGDQSTFGYPELTDEGVTVHAVAVNIVARKTDAGERTLAPLVRHDGSTITGATMAGLSTDYLALQAIYDANPETTEDWTLEDLNASEFGVEVIA
jgi:hypothetical protein